MGGKVLRWRRDHDAPIRCTMNPTAARNTTASAIHATRRCVWKGAGAGRLYLHWLVCRQGSDGENQHDQNDLEQDGLCRLGSHRRAGLAQRCDHFAYIIGDDEGYVRPLANVTRAETAAIFFRLLKEDVREEYLTDRSGFADVEQGAWYNKAVSTRRRWGW